MERKSPQPESHKNQVSWVRDVMFTVLGFLLGFLYLTYSGRYVSRLQMKNEINLHYTNRDEALKSIENTRRITREYALVEYKKGVLGRAVEMGLAHWAGGNRDGLDYFVWDDRPECPLSYIIEGKKKAAPKPNPSR